MDPVAVEQEMVDEQQLVNDDDDRISNLPPELIGKILSSLPTTKEAVATCVLSSTWKWFWTFITSLKFIDGPRADFSKPSFISFIYRLIEYRKPTTLDYFGILCYGLNKANVSHLREWVYATDVKELDLSIDSTSYGSYNPSHMLPFELFSCKKLFKLTLGNMPIDIRSVVCLPNLQALKFDTVEFPGYTSLNRLLIGCPALEELKVFGVFKPDSVLPKGLFSSCTKLANLRLMGCFVVDVPTLVSLPNLEAMSLVNVTFLDDDSIKRLLYGCPSLRELEIKMDHVGDLHVDLPFLSKLAVTCWGPDGWGNLVLETPSLRYLKVDGLAADRCELIDLNQLAEAELYAIRYPQGYGVPTNLITGLANVKMLYLCGSLMEAIVKGGCELPQFHKLTALKLGVSYDIGWAAVPVLLEKSPYIETLVFDEGIKEYFECRPVKHSLFATLYAPQKVPHCLLYHLKVIEIRDFGEDIEGEGMIQYFIENGGVMKDLTIIQYSSGSGAPRVNRKTVYQRRSGQEATKKL